ncbi:hypothetical protein ES708_05744 [subsurface metagenome]
MPEISRQVIASSDDAFRRLTPSYWSRVVSIRAGAFNSANYQYGCGMRFTNITIPPGSTIDQAYFTFKCLTRYTGTVIRSRISAEDVDNAPTFADDSAAFDTRWTNRTTARMDWDNIPFGIEGEDFNSITTDGVTTFASIIQEIIDREGWASGQAIVIFWEDFEDRSTHNGPCIREAYSYDNNSAYAPKLVITYTKPSAPIVTGSASGSGIGLSLASSYLIIPAIASGQGQGLGFARARQFASIATIDNVEIVLARNSLMVDQRIKERSIAEFTILDLEGSKHYQKGQPVKIYDPHGDLIFAGVIDTPEEERM